MKLAALKALSYSEFVSYFEQFNNEDSYEKLKSQIDEVKIIFFHSELSNFVNYADDEYHFIDLSNIYIHMFQKKILG